jgi:SWI/SNF-related matrix-associated actin-dependent regulator of chromatin subfamily A member 5
MAPAGENPTTDSTTVAINKDGDDDNSDVELEGMDLEGDDGGDDDVDDDVEMEAATATVDSADTKDAKDATDKLATEDQDEYEAAHRERTELMAEERKKAVALTDDSNDTMEHKLHYLLSQSEVFAHFLAGSVAASEKKRGGGKKKGGSRGKKNRMTEAEEDAQLLKTAESKRSVIRLSKQVGHSEVEWG